MRRFQTLEFKIATTLTFLSLFLPPQIQNIDGLGKSLKYGYLYGYISILQDKEGLGNSILSNLFNNKSFSLTILDMFANIIVFYYIIKFIKSIYLKYIYQ